jgi:hypothetical protein
VNANRLTVMLGMANVFIGVANTAAPNLLIGLVMAAVLYLDRS